MPIDKASNQIDKKIQMSTNKLGQISPHFDPLRAVFHPGTFSPPSDLKVNNSTFSPIFFVFRLSIGRSLHVLTSILLWSFLYNYLKKIDNFDEFFFGTWVHENIRKSFKFQVAYWLPRILGGINILKMFKKSISPSHCVQKTRNENIACL